MLGQCPAHDQGEISGWAPAGDPDLTSCAPSLLYPPGARLPLAGEAALLAPEREEGAAETASPALGLQPCQPLAWVFIPVGPASTPHWDPLPICGEKVNHPHAKRLGKVPPPHQALFIYALIFGDDSELLAALWKGGWKWK